MKRKLYLMAGAAVTLLFASSVVDARSHHSRKVPHKVFQQMRDYYPQKPQYPHSPVHKRVADGVLGSVLGYEIAKESAVTSGLGISSASYLEHSKIEKH